MKKSELRKLIRESIQSILKEDWWSDLGAEGQDAYIKQHPSSQKAKEAKAKEPAKKVEKNYNTELNSILEPKADEEFKKILTPEEYNALFKSLASMDNRASEKAISVGDSYFPLDDASGAINYLDNYFNHFSSTRYKTAYGILQKLKNYQRNK